MSHQNEMVGEVLAGKGREGKYLTFSLGNEDYGIAITRIREIIGMMTITAVPQTEPHVKGVINLRGRVIPVIDLRLRFGLEEADYTERTCIVVVEIAVAKGEMPMGLIVDSVSEVLAIKGEQIEDAPAFSGESSNTLLGIGKVKDEVIILLDIDRVLGREGLETLAQAA